MYSRRACRNQPSLGKRLFSLIVDDLVIIYGAAQNSPFSPSKKDSGTVKWKSGSELATHATPILTEIHELEQVIFFCQSGLVSLQPKSGNELWRQEFPYKVSTAASPVVAGDLVYCSAGYGVGAGLYKITKRGSKFSSEQVWRKPNDVINHWSTPVYHDGHTLRHVQFQKIWGRPSSVCRTQDWPRKMERRRIWSRQCHFSRQEPTRTF